jgi:O-antigen/teichoic acid export membrane protein
MSTIKRKTVNGILWSLSQQFATRGITLLTTLVLAWFLSPADYGLIAMIAVFIEIASSLMNSGFQNALVRLPEAIPEDFNTAFFANLVLGVFSYILLYITAPLIAEFYEEEKLVLLIRVTGIVVLIRAFGVVQEAQITRNMNFKKLFRAAMPATVISAILAITLAYFSFGVWALVTQMLVSALCSVMIIWWGSAWRPSNAVSLDSLNKMYKFGYKLFLGGLSDSSFKNMYVIVIAKLFSTSVAGLYFFADRLREMLIFQLVYSIQKVTYPALCSIQEDPIRMKQGYRKLIRLTSFILFPLIIFIAALADQIFHLLLSEKWWAASVYFQLMCLAGVLIPIHAINLNILMVLGRSDLILWLEIIKKGMLVAILMISYHYGVIGILIGQIVSSVLAYMPNSFYSKKLIDYGVKQQLSDFSPSLLLAGAIGFLIFVVQKMLPWHDLTNVIVLGTASMILYLLVSHLLRVEALREAKVLFMKR